MATHPRKKRLQEILDETEQRSDWAALAEHARKNPMLYVAGTAFVVVCILAGVFYHVSASSRKREDMTRLVQALEAQEPSERVTALAPLAEGAATVAPQALYLRGEEAYVAQEYDTAKESFENLRSQYPQSQYTPDAVEGLGNIAENKESYDKAVEYYQEIRQLWPDSFAARRQPFNIGRCREKLGAFEDAIAAYREQVDEVFPGSNVAEDAQEALDRLREEHPELFPQEVKAERPEAPITETEPLTEIQADLGQEPETAEPPSPAPPAETPAPEAPAAEEAPASEEPAPGAGEESSPE